MKKKTTCVLLLVAIFILPVATYCINKLAARNSAEPCNEPATDSQSGEVVTPTSGAKSKRNKVVYGEDGAYLLSGADGSVLAGPYKFIKESDSWKADSIVRYIGENSKMGYISFATGELVTLPIYSEASRMNGQGALVREGDELYFINTLGQRYTDKVYSEAIPFVENSACTSVKLMGEETWSIINRQGEIILTDCEKITLPESQYMLGAAIKEKTAVVFQLDYSSKEQISIIGRCEGITDIVDIRFGEFVIVTAETTDSAVDADGNPRSKYGVIDYNGNIIIPVEYLCIEYEVIDEENLLYGEKVLFLCQKVDGTYDVIIHAF